MDYPRGHTDPLANLVVISSLDIQRHLPEIVERDFPISSLPTFLHEVMHHWCFDSPVGFVLHLLFLRARRSALQLGLGSGSDDQARKVYNDVVRYESALALTRPLSEGLALFAEHDAIPGDTRTISVPMQFAAAMYARGFCVREPEKPFEGLDLLLAAARVSRNHIRRKADLLIQPLRCDDGGYLPGYLFVKQLWAGACGGSARFFDTDFYLQYLRHYLYDDWGLVARLLDDSTRDVNVLDPVSRRINSRIREFVTTGTGDASAADFERSRERNELLSVEIRTPVFATDFHYLAYGDDADSELGRTRLKESIEEFFKEWPQDEMLYAMMDQDMSDLAMRGILNLGHGRLDGRKSEKGLELHTEKGRLFTVPEDQLLVRTAIEGRVDVDVVTTRDTASLHIVLMQGPKVLACLTFGGEGPASALLQRMSDRASRTANAELWQDLVSSALEKGGLVDDVKIVRARIRDMLNEKFIPVALMRADAARLPALMQATATDGLLPLLDGKLGLVLDAAAASLCLPSTYHLREVESFHQWSQGTAMASLEMVNRLLENQIGLAPFMFNRGEVVRKSLI